MKRCYNSFIYFTLSITHEIQPFQSGSGFSSALRRRARFYCRQSCNNLCYQFRILRNLRLTKVSDMNTLVDSVLDIHAVLQRNIPLPAFWLETLILLFQRTDSLSQKQITSLSKKSLNQNQTADNTLGALVAVVQYIPLHLCYKNTTPGIPKRIYEKI